MSFVLSLLVSTCAGYELATPSTASVGKPAVITSGPVLSAGPVLSSGPVLSTAPHSQTAVAEAAATVSNPSSPKVGFYSETCGPAMTTHGSLDLINKKS
jgi:hypothetical protein